MDRRDFIKKASVGGLGLTLSKPLEAMAGKSARQPNILFVMVDEFRFPSVFPSGVKNVNEFLRKFMPNTHTLWKNGVKFSKHFSAGVACTPSRGVMITGLYTQQTWMMQTLKGTPDTKVSIPPVLDPAFPTYGKLLRDAGYQTPYIGKWHLSLPRSKHELEPYGFDGMTLPDPTGANLQGTVGDEANGYHSDQDISDQATSWLAAKTPSDQPWCLTVAFQNPHDHMFFWAGTEFKRFNDLFDSQTEYQPGTYYSKNKGTDYPPTVPWDKDVLKNPPSYGYPDLPPNWETAAHLAAHKPSTQTFGRTITEFMWGGITDNPKENEFKIQPYPKMSGYGSGIAPFSYWQRNLDSYTQILGIVDQRIGEVLAALPASVASNTVIVLTSDHGDYAGAHGIVANKWCSGYDEVYNVPLIVMDPTGNFAGDVGTVREELTSSVDLLGLLVSLGNNGSQSWISGKYEKIYGSRHNMMPMLKSAAAPGRSYVLLVTDELTMSNYNFNDAPLHIVGMRTKTEKLAHYAKWHPLTSRLEANSIELEFYDYSTEGGKNETDNTPHDSRVPPLAKELHTVIIPNELQAALPGLLGLVQERAKQEYLLFAELMLNPPKGDRSPKFLKKWLGLGADA